MNGLSCELSPAQLAYGAALRGVAPRFLGGAYTYAQVGPFAPQALVCLAASNPDGRFFGLLEEEGALASAKAEAASRKVWNLSFVAREEDLPEALDFLCCDETAERDDRPFSREKLFDMAQRRLRAGGTFAFRYRAYDAPRSALRFLLSEYENDLDPAQGEAFLADIKALGTRFFAGSPQDAAILDKAIAAKDAKILFEALRAAPPATSGTFETLAGLLPRGFAFAGDAEIADNYLELAAPLEAHETILKCREHLLYEPIKDFALARLVRSDIWIKLPVEQTEDAAALFGGFTFGMTMAPEKVPSRLAVGVDLTQPLYAELIALMSLLPLGIGDFLAHPSGQSFAPSEVLGAVQILVAAGIARPMRGRYEGRLQEQPEKPVWANAFNEGWSATLIEVSPVPFASTVIGGVWALPAREALVLQALGRVGLSHLAGSLLPELERLVQNNPALAAQIMDTCEPTDESVRSYVADVLQKNLVRWYAYGLLAA